LVDGSVEANVFFLASTARFDALIRNAKRIQDINRTRVQYDALHQ